MVIKTGPDRPVQPVRPGTGLVSGSVIVENRPISEPVGTGQEPVEPVKNR